MDAATKALLASNDYTRPMSPGIATDPHTPRETYVQLALASNAIDTTYTAPTATTAPTAPAAAVYSPTAGIVWTGDSIKAAQAFARAQNRVCAAQGGYGDRTAYAVGEGGFLVDDAGGYVWPAHGRSSGAVRV